VVGREIRALSRRGKYLLAQLSDGHRLLMHLGMTGQLFTERASSVRLLSATGRAALRPEEQARFQPDSHTHLVFELAPSGSERVLFRDVRKFGKVKLLGPDEQDERLSRLGPDALEVTGALLSAAARGKRVAIKSLLLDQRVLAGAGNIYADECLFLARVRPGRAAARVTRQEHERIADGLRRVLMRSIETGGSSINDYVQPDGSDGGFQDERKVYGLTGQPCSVCGTAIARNVIGQRSSHYCPVCQR